MARKQKIKLAMIQARQTAYSLKSLWKTQTRQQIQLQETTPLSQSQHRMARRQLAIPSDNANETNSVESELALDSASPNDQTSSESNNAPEIAKPENSETTSDTMFRLRAVQMIIRIKMKQLFQRFEKLRTYQIAKNPSTKYRQYLCLTIVGTKQIYQRHYLTTCQRVTKMAQKLHEARCPRLTRICLTAAWREDSNKRGSLTSLRKMRSWSFVHCVSSPWNLWRKDLWIPSKLRRIYPG